ncbi:MAG: glycosyltransferase N-terminal domain-containing protein, partial [Flavisolibacter sp.]
MILVYNLFIRLYVLGIRIAGLWSKKAREWIEGRRGVFNELSSKISKEDKIIWIHCASAGEFEQGKPVIEELKNHYPSYKILVSFFSPSGY